MSNEKPTRKLDRTELIAAVTSSVIIAVVVVYWIFQISGVLEMLELAYG